MMDQKTIPAGQTEKSGFTPGAPMDQDSFFHAFPALLSQLREGAAPGAVTKRILVTVDGPSCSGKSTFAEKLARLSEGYVIHTDDFVVPHAAKTKERLSIPGGNCDWERISAEVLRPWKEGADSAFRRYDFRNDRLRDPEPLPSGVLLILEGSYSNLPALREFADLRIFLTTPLALREERLSRRESPESQKRFHELWIPLENAYFEAFGLPDPGCILVC